MCLAHSTYSVQMKSTTHAASTINPSITKNMACTYSYGRCHYTLLYLTPSVTFLVKNTSLYTIQSLRLGLKPQCVYRHLCNREERNWAQSDTKVASRCKHWSCCTRIKQRLLVEEIGSVNYFIVKLLLSKGS